MSKIKKLNEKELLQQTEEQIKFLTSIYPQLLEDTYHECCIEIRPIKRTKDTKYVNSLNLWKLDDEGINRLIDFNRKINGSASCVYYSTFAFDYSLECQDKIKGKINNKNARYTTFLPLDFDDLELSDIAAQLDILENLGLKTTKIFSGNGIQALILLDKKVYDVNILKKWTTILIQKGFKVDSSLVDPARVLRMPYTFNCKQFDINNKKYSPNPIEIQTDLWEISTERYDLIDVFNKIQTLKDIIPPTKEEVEELKELQNTPKVEFKEPSINPLPAKTLKTKEILEVVKTDIEVVKSTYGHIIPIKQIPDAVINMLYGAKEGVRNDTLLFLVPYLRNTLKLNEDEIVEVIKIWGSRCNPPYEAGFSEEESKRLLTYRTDYKYGKYTDKMKSIYGPLEVHIYKKNNTVEIYNDIFDNGGIIKISDCAFKIYLYLELTKDQKQTYTMKEIEKLTSIPLVTVRRNIKDLIRYGYVSRKTSYKKNKEEYLYTLSDYRSRAKGVTIFNKAALKLMLMELTDGEIKLYAYLNRMLNNKLKVTAGQKYLSLKTGKSQPRISCITTALKEKGYIDKITFRDDYKLLHCIYALEI